MEIVGLILAMAATGAAGGMLAGLLGVGGGIVIVPVLELQHRIPVVPGVALKEGTYGLEDVKLIDGYDPTEWAAKRDACQHRTVALTVT